MQDLFFFSVVGQERTTMMEVKLHTTRKIEPVVPPNPLPHVIQTKAGLALLEIQGTINLPDHGDEDAFNSTSGEGGDGKVMETPIGRLVFPDYEGNEGGDNWMKRVYLYVGKHQRLTGEVKKLPKAIAVIRKRKDEGGDQNVGAMEGEESAIEELEVVEIVKYKILFSIRPEPVGTWAAGD
jgi:chromosome transmission fidelity protein 8